VAGVEAERAQAVLVGAVRYVPVEAHDLRMYRIRSRVLAWATGQASAGGALAGAITGPEVIGRDTELVWARRR
jgi:hypothetical protein